MLARMRLDIDKAIGNYDTVGNMVFAHPRRINNAFGYVNAIRSKYRGKDMEKALQTVIKAGLQDELRWSNSTERDVVFESDPARCKT
jgi:hypothetical protein